MNAEGDRERTATLTCGHRAINRCLGSLRIRLEDVTAVNAASLRMNGCGYVNPWNSLIAPVPKDSEDNRQDDEQAYSFHIGY